LIFAPPKIDKPLPNRNEVRTEMLDAIVVKSKTLNLPPNLLVERMLQDEPTWIWLTKLKDTNEPTRTRPATETELPSRTKPRMLKQEPDSATLSTDKLPPNLPK
jgi:hypothetical protein